MAQQIKLTDGRTALFDSGESLESIDRKLAEAGLERAKPRSVTQEVMAKINEPIVAGASAVLGLPGLLESGLRYGERKIGEFVAGRPLRPKEMPQQVLPTPTDIQRAARQAGIPTERAETLPGQALQSFVRNIVSAPVPGAVIPAALSAAGEEALAVPFRGTQLEPMARTVGAMATPLAQVPFIARSPAQRIAAEELQRITPTQMRQAEQIQATGARVGTPVTAAEALQQATGGATRMPEVQRMIESSVGGGPLMRQYLAGREAQTRQTLESMFPATARAELGVEAQKAAQEAQRGAAREVSQRVEPMFAQIRGVEIPKDTFESIVKDNAIVKSVYNSVKNKPEWKEASKNIPENSVGFVEIMRQELGDRMSAAYREGASNRARVLNQAYDDLKVVADDAVGGSYQQALTATRQAREQIQRPLESTPIADIAETADTARQFASLFAKNAVDLNLTPDKVKTTIQALSKKDPNLATDFVNQYLRGSLEKISPVAQRQAVTGGRFADTVWGNETQRRNLLTAYEEAFGANAAKGLDEMLVALKAQAQRLPVGSPTAEKAALAQRAEGVTRKAISQPLGGVAMLVDQIINGRDMERFARVLTSNDGVAQLQKIATSKDKAKVGLAATEIQRLLEGTTGE